MDDFWKSLFTTLWWVSVFIVGVIINVASNYVQRGVDRFGDWLPATLRRRSAAARAAHTRRVAAIQESKDALLVALAMETRERVRAMAYYLAAVFFGGFAVVGEVLGPPLRTFGAAGWGDRLFMIGVVLFFVWAMVMFLLATAFSNGASKLSRAIYDVEHAPSDKSTAAGPKPQDHTSK